MTKRHALAGATLAAAGLTVVLAGGVAVEPALVVPAVVVLVGLLVGEVARKNDLRLDPKRLNETMRLIASTYEEPEQVIEMYRNDPQLMSGLQNRVMEEQVIDWIAERAQHTEEKLSFQDAIRQ